MARISLALARPVLETGAAVRYPQGGGPVGAAVEGLGAGIAGLAAHVEAAGRRREVFDAALREQEFLDELAAPLPLKALTLLPSEARPDSDAVLPLTAAGGGALGTLAWEPHQPGLSFLTSIAPSLAVAFTVILAFTWVVLRHARMTTRAIEASEARFRDVADASSDWIWETDSELRLSFLSEPSMACARCSLV